MDIEQALNWSDHHALASSQDREQFECMTKLAEEVREMRNSFAELDKLCRSTSHVDTDCVEALIQNYVPRRMDAQTAATSAREMEPK